MESGEMYMRGRAGNRTHRGSKGGERESTAMERGHKKSH